MNQFFDNDYWKRQSEFMNSYGHQGPIEPSPWTLPITPRNQVKKFKYVMRQHALLTEWINQTNDKELLRRYAADIVLWDKRRAWVLSNKL